MTDLKGNILSEFLGPHFPHCYINLQDSFMSCYNKNKPQKGKLLFFANEYTKMNSEL